MTLFIIELSRSNEQRVGVNTSISQVIWLSMVCADTSHSYFWSFPAHWDDILRQPELPTFFTFVKRSKSNRACNLRIICRIAWLGRCSSIFVYMYYFFSICFSSLQVVKNLNENVISPPSTLLYTPYVGSINQRRNTSNHSYSCVNDA